MSLTVKICGISTIEALDAALDGGADMIGLVFFPSSPRNLDLDAAAALARRAAGKLAAVALTVDATDAELATIAEMVRPDALQLHGRESPERVRNLKARFGLPVWKAIPVAHEADLARAADYASAADRLVFDARAPRDATRPGGLGVPFDWRLLEDFRPGKPFMLSGGLGVGNVAEALAIARPWGVDVSSGVERAPGEKDPGKIRDFIRVARQAARALAVPAAPMVRSA